MAKRAPAKSTTRNRNTKKQPPINQPLAVLCFAVSVFVFALAVYPGGSAWRTLHNGVLGTFGITAYVWPIYAFVATTLYSSGRLTGSPKMKTLEVGGLLFLIATAADIFSTSAAADTYPQHLASVFAAASFRNGGVMGALLGNGIFRLFEKVGAIIFIVIALLAFLMLITGTTVAKVIRGAAVPVKKVSEKAGAAIEEVRAETRKKYDVDIPVENDYKPEDEKDLSEHQRRLVETYNGFDDSAETLKTDPPAKEKKIRRAEKSAEKTAEPVPESAEPAVQLSLEDGGEQTPEPVEKIKMTSSETAAQIADVAREINSGIVISEEEGYHYPPLQLLKEPTHSDPGALSAELDSTANRLVEVLHSFGVETKIIDISRGPTVTRYELQPCAGVKISKITALADDIALNLAAAGVRIEAPIPNKPAVGIEVPNKTSSVVCVREILESAAFKNAKSKLTVALGKDIAGNAVVTDIAKMPHGLIAGATGSGKSVCINSIIMSLLYKATPEEVKLLMIDPKVVELGIYNGIPHLLVPVVTDPRKASGALGWAVTEMERRYRLFADNNVRDLAGFNHLCEMDTDLKKLPHIVIIIDELADLMMTAPGEVEDAINRIAAKARAAGMHLLIATQRPSVDVVTGVIKANIPTRIAFAVSSQVDSRTILDIGGAEKLLGRGDMLFNPVGASKPSRIQGCFVSDEEVEKVTAFVKADHAPDDNNSQQILSEIDRLAASDKKNKNGSDEENGSEEDTMLPDAIRTVVELGQASTSLLQRKLKLGYSRAARVMDQMEQKGVIGPYEGSKPRQVLWTAANLMEMDDRHEETKEDQ